MAVVRKSAGSVIHKLSPDVVDIIHLIRTNWRSDKEKAPPQSGAPLATFWRLSCRDRYRFAGRAVRSPILTRASPERPAAEVSASKADQISRALAVSPAVV